MKLLLAFALFAFVVAGNCSAATKDAKAVLGFNADISMLKVNALEIDLASNPEAAGKAKTDMDQQMSQIDADVKSAIAVAKGNADLVKAIKECFLAAQAYARAVPAYSAIERAVKKRAEADLDRAKGALELEIQLAGIHL